MLPLPLPVRFWVWMTFPLRYGITFIPAKFQYKMEKQRPGREKSWCIILAIGVAVAVAGPVVDVDVISVTSPDNVYTHQILDSECSFMLQP